MRPGRLDRILYVSPPDFEARKHIFRVNFAKMAVNGDVDVDELAALVRSSPLTLTVHSRSSQLSTTDRWLLWRRVRFHLPGCSADGHERGHEHAQRASPSALALPGVLARTDVLSCSHRCAASTLSKRPRA